MPEAPKRVRRRNPESRCAFKLEALKREVYALQCTITQLQRRKSSSLSWEDVARALQDDTLRLVGENRELQRTQRAYARFYRVVTACAQLSIDRVPTLTEETWRHAQLLAGDPASRQLGCEWILKQVHFNTTRAMAHIAFPSDGASYVDVHVNIEADLLQIHVTTQQVLAFTLAEVADAYWIAEQSFARMYVGQTLDAATDDVLPHSPPPTVQYIQESLKYGLYDVCYNVLSGRFDEPRRTTLVLRTILQDEMHPTAPSAWLVDTKQWTVADALGPNLTRCRTYYTIQHPMLGQSHTSVPLADFASVFGIPAGHPRDVASALRNRSEANHRRQRTSFQAWVVISHRDATTMADAEAPKKRRMTIKLPIKPSQDPRLDHIKSKRAKALEALRRYTYELTTEVCRLKRGQVAMLPWEDVAIGLKEDMLEKVRENRALKQEMEARRRMCQFLHDCLGRSSPFNTVPSLAEETWRHSQLLSGPSRELGCEWILNQLYHNTERAMAHVQFPDDGRELDCIDVNVVSSGGLIRVEVMSQEYLPYALEHVVEAYGIAAASFTKAYLRKVAGYLDDSKAGVSTDIHYESVLQPHRQHTICYNTLSRFFLAGDRCVLALRTILKDDEHPVPTSTWIMNTKQWVVIDRLGPHLTRCRTFYTIDHPCSEAGGYVSVAEMMRFRGLPICANEAQNLMLLRDRFHEQHRLQRSFFQMHARCVAETLAVRLPASEGLDEWTAMMQAPEAAW
ncbi:hypothetical protein ACHHYP_09786 [Achlya hypogyna]|uniref:Uncharacterized protein n=1 Tax=Achlya hypogyna TaxID=1202772 RepID=A0A1V9YMI4_ACHHY|nr:hypothetical protein ACHHYP_09786 [Achlya hypogyna]